MPSGSVSETIPATAGDVFALLHDYRRRLEWDTLLQAAVLDPEWPVACQGAVSTCTGRAILGGIAMRTRYVTFHAPEIAAVQLIGSPPFFARFSASIRHAPAGPHASTVTYRYHFQARPAWLRWFLHPLMGAVFRWETRKRLRALRAHFSQPARA